MQNEIDFGNCPECGRKLYAIHFLEYEYENGMKTGRERLAVDVLSCASCLTTFTVDDTLSEPWHYPRLNTSFMFSIMKQKD